MQQPTVTPTNIRAIIGLGNPGPKFVRTRHNIGFMVLDAFAEKMNAQFSGNATMESASVLRGDKSILLIKPQTFMNSSGAVVPILRKKGIAMEEMVVVHDELELPFGSIKWKFGGSAKGHNGLKSIISQGDEQFWRLRVGIGRPDDRNEVPDYVLTPFKESRTDVEHIIDQAVSMLELILNK